jgi:hypothetical protein
VPALAASLVGPGGCGPTRLLLFAASGHVWEPGRACLRRRGRGRQAPDGARQSCQRVAARRGPPANLGQPLVLVIADLADHDAAREDARVGELLGVLRRWPWCSPG